MNSANYKQMEGFVGKSYTEQAISSRNSFEKKMKALLSNRRMPETGWNNQLIINLLNELSMMDTNNFIDNIGAGEREGRVFSEIVKSRHWCLSHGIGRSGDIAAIQPKAAGSSLINKITNCMIKCLIKNDIPKINDVLIFPMATGMAIVMTLLTIRDRIFKNKKIQPNFILWFRIDQKTCLKAMLTAGFQVIVIENKLEGYVLYFLFYFYFWDYRIIAKQKKKIRTFAILYQ